MVDTFLLLMLARSGDSLQGIKKGVLELADVIAVNKADGDRATEAAGAAKELAAALHLVAPSPHGWDPPVLTCSALEGDGLDEVWSQVGAHRAHLDRLGDARPPSRAGCAVDVVDDRRPPAQPIPPVRRRSAELRRQCAREHDGQAAAPNCSTGGRGMKPVRSAAAVHLHDDDDGPAHSVLRSPQDARPSSTTARATSGIGNG